MTIYFFLFMPFIIFYLVEFWIQWLFPLIIYCLILAALDQDPRLSKTSGLVFFYYFFIFTLYFFFIYSNIQADFLWALLLWDKLLFWFVLLINMDFIFNKCVCFWLFWFFYKLGWQKCSSFVSKLSFFCSLYFISFLVNWTYKFIEKLISKADNAFLLVIFLLLLLNILVVFISILYFFIRLSEDYSLIFFYRISKKLNLSDLINLICFILIILVIAHLYEVSFLLLLFIFYFIKTSYTVILEALVIYKKDRVSLNFLYWFFFIFSNLVYKSLNYQQLETLAKLSSCYNNNLYCMVFCYLQHVVINYCGSFWLDNNNKFKFLFQGYGFYVEKLLLLGKHNFFISTSEQINLALKLSRLFNLSFYEERALIRKMKKNNYNEKNLTFSTKNLLTRAELLLGLVKADPTIREYTPSLADEESAEFLIIFLKFLRFWTKETREGGSEGVNIYHLKDYNLKVRSKAALVKDDGKILHYLQLVRSNHILNPKEFLNLLDQCEKDGHLLVLAVPFLSLQNQMDQLKADNIFKFYSSTDSSFSREDAKLLEEKIKISMKYNYIFEGDMDMDLPWTDLDLYIYKELVEFTADYYSMISLKDIDDKIFFDQLLSNILLNSSLR